MISKTAFVTIGVGHLSIQSPFAVLVLMSIFDDDDDLVCTTDPQVRPGSAALQVTSDDALYDAQAVAEELRDKREHHELLGATDAALASVATEQARGAAPGSARRQVVPLGSRRTSASGEGSARRVGGATPGLQDELRAVMNQLRAQERAVQQLTLESDKQQKLIASMTSRLERESHERKELEQRLKLADTQLMASKKEVLLLQRQIQTASTTTDDARLQKALQENERLRAQLTAAGNPATSSAATSAVAAGESFETSQLKADNRRLEQQRVELMNCVRKQNKLIDILKRQKMHLEAAKLLQITEEEFTKLLEVSHK